MRPSSSSSGGPTVCIKEDFFDFCFFEPAMVWASMTMHSHKHDLISKVKHAIATAIAIEIRP